MDRIAGASSVRGYNSSQPRTVTLRGFDSRYNSMVVDGNPIWNASRNNRGTQLDVFPAGTVSEINAFKTVTPDQDANSIGGHLELRTMRAFDGGSQPYFRLNAALGKYDQTGEEGSDTLSYRLSGVGKRAFGPNQRFGIVAGGAVDRDRFSEVYNTITGYSQIGGIDVVNGSIFHGRGDKDVSRTSFYGKLEAHATDQLYAFVSASYFRQRNEEQYYRGGPFLTATAVTNVGPGTGAFTRATNEQYLESYELDRTTWLIGSGLDYRVGSRSVVAIRGAYTRYAHDEVDSISEKFQFANVAGTYTLTDTEGLLSLTPNAQISDPANWNYANRNNRPSTHTRLPDRDNVYSLRADYDFNAFATARGFGFKSGLYWRRLDRNFDQTVDSYSLPSGVTLNLGQVLDARASRTLDGVAPATIDPDAFWGFMESKGTLTRTLAPGSDYRLTEDVFAAHAATTYTLEDFRLLAGFRVETTRATNSTGNVVNGVVTPVTWDIDYTNLLPNLQAFYDLTRQLRLRLAYTQTLARPDFNSFAMGQTVTPDGNGNPIVSGTNPRLPPREASNYDSSIEYYFSDGYVSLGAFYKDLRHETFTQQTQTRDGSGNVILTERLPLDSGAGTLRGLEFSFARRTFRELPAPLNAFGLRASYTYLDGHWNVVFTDGSRRTVNGLRNQPKWLGNVELTYTRRTFDLTLAWRLRGRTFTGTFGTDAAGDGWTGRYQRLDLQAGFALRRGLKLFVEARNLNNAFWIEDMGLTRSMTSSVNPGRSFGVGMKYQM